VLCSARALRDLDMAIPETMQRYRKSFSEDDVVDRRQMLLVFSGR
jgi:hypothetical protein